ncbi:hypothetical protein V1282_003491 [Nitrobacteraceae bacterium AZCC 2146]
MPNGAAKIFAASNLADGTVIEGLRTDSSARQAHTRGLSGKN